MTVSAVAGTKLYIGAAGVSVPSPDNMTEIGNVSNLGQIGTTFAKIAVESVGSGYTKQIKGTQSAPAFPLVLNRDDDDAGQILVLAASNNRNSLYPFRLVDNDGTNITFMGRVYGFNYAYGGVNDLRKVNSEIEVEPDTISVV